jgi:hypothetical protein
MSPQKREKRKSEGWLIFLVIYLAGLAYFAIRVPEWFSSGGWLIIAFVWFLLACLIGSAINFIWSIWKAIVAKKESEGGWQGAARSARRINWTKVFGVVLTSNFFFLASCTGGMVATWVSNEKMGGQYVEPGVKPYGAMVVIAAVPNPATQGAVQFEQVPLENMEKFKTANPTHSFLLPLGPGRVQKKGGHRATIGGDGSTTYEVRPVRDGKVLVETKFHQEFGGLLIMRYDATDKSVQPIFTNNVQWFVAFLLGLVLAIFLYILGWVLRYWTTKEHHAPATADLKS